MERRWMGREREGVKEVKGGGGGEKRSVYKALNIDWCWSRIPAFPPLKNFLFAKPILYIHTHIHTYIRAYVHTYIHTYVHGFLHKNWKKHYSIHYNGLHWYR